MFYGIEPSPDDWRVGVGPIEITRTEIAIGNLLLCYCCDLVCVLLKVVRAYCTVLYCLL